MKKYDVIRKVRKALISDLFSMFLATQQVHKSVSREYSDKDVKDILDEILAKFFKIVTRGVQFVDVLDEEVNLSRTLIEMSVSGHC